MDALDDALEHPLEHTLEGFAEEGVRAVSSLLDCILLKKEVVNR